MKTKQVLVSIIAITLILASCNQYSKISYSKTSVLEKKEVAEKIQEYNVYIHQNDKTYLLKNPTVLEEVISGVPVEITNEETKSGDTLSDMHLILNEGVSEITNTEDIQHFGEVNVKEVEMYGRKRSTGANIVLIVLAAIGATLVLIGLIFGALLLLLGGSDGPDSVDSGFGTSGSGGSDGSDSGGSSTSDSGGSDSGGSDSGGSDFGGCYIATMSYGSYDAPQVLILREFRDRFLNRFGAGRSFIAWYYRTSPNFVEKHRSKKWLHSIIRVPLTGFVVFLKLFYSGDRAKS